MKKTDEKFFHAWKCLLNCDPIEGTDRIFRARSKRDVINEEN